jgi:CheY-like chemotaxis protein
LEHAGTRVHEAADRYECLVIVQRCQPDLILLDLQMPNLDGMTGLGMLREHCPTAKYRHRQFDIVH